MSCKKECFEATITNCTDDIILKAGLAATTQYFWLVEDRHGNITQRQATTDAQGTLTIATPLFINPHSGMLKLSVREGGNYLNVVPMTFDAEEYNCVLITIAVIDREDSDDSPINQIGA